ncbi:WYL domain-containing protein [Macrococcoides canis]|uniref:WYL domain-containing protein n=1 Tax=Macrococcoides canis TaxID=1855823 RepID=UPI00105FB27D|nr:WYL domain-containing protein [Macrococcus canis]TDM32128.1 WYL domain-containing protein [Macrococcus canis]
MMLIKQLCLFTCSRVKIESIKIEYTGISEEAILDKFPINSKEKKDGKIIITIDAIGDGVYMWLLSQGDNIKVISPESVKQEMKRRIQNMMKIYQYQYKI